MMSLLKALDDHLRSPREQGVEGEVGNIPHAFILVVKDGGERCFTMQAERPRP
jgi:hypothetical protein